MSPADASRRIHQKPSRREVDACLPWLREELRLVRPDVLVILGATAGHALFGPGFRLTHERGRPIDSDLAQARHVERRAFTRDLQTAADLLERTGGA